MDDYDGKDVIDRDGDPIGTVERTFADDRGAAHFVEVRTGRLFVKHRLIPIDKLEISDGRLRVPYQKDTIESSPDAAATGDTLEGETLESVRAYYRESDTSETPQNGDEEAALSGAGDSPSREDTA